MENYIQRFEIIVRDLEANPQFDVIDYKRSPPLSMSKISDIESEYFIKLNKSIRCFYNQSNGLRLTWHLCSEDIKTEDMVSGSIRLLPLEQVFGGWDGEGWLDDLWFDWMNEAEQEERKKLKPFDYFDGDDSGCICFQVRGQKIEQRLVFHSVDYGINELQVDFDSYLNMTLETRGFFRWQFLILSDKRTYGYQAKKNDFYFYMPQIFPETDFSKFR